MAETNTPQNSPDEQLNAIQNIIVGPAIRDLNDRLAALAEKLDQQGQEMADLVSDHRSELDQEMQKQQEEIYGEIKELKANLEKELGLQAEEKVSRQELGKLLVDLGKTLMKPGS